MVFDVVAEGFRLLTACLGLGDINLLRLGSLGQRLQRRLGLEPLAEVPVGVQGTDHRRQPHDLQNQQRTVPAGLLQRNGGGKKTVGGMEDIQLCGKEEQSGKQQQADIGRLAVLCPGQELQHSAAAENTKPEKSHLGRQKEQIQQRAPDKTGKERRLHGVDDAEGEL